VLPFVLWIAPMPKPKPSHALWVMMLTFALAACECNDIKSSGPSPSCVRAGDQCKLPDGPLGVCNTVDCGPGQAAPCLTCMSQH
jgi:hypothetical protein